MSKSLIIVQLILVLLTRTVKVNSETELVVTANPEKLIVIEGKEAILKCTIASEALGNESMGKTFQAAQLTHESFDHRSLLQNIFFDICQTELPPTSGV